jgi:branched-chain amino acid transport system ATP-binding protein
MEKDAHGTPILKLSNLSVGYFDEPVVEGVDLSVSYGTITTLIGPNGAGKSTLMRGIYGLIRKFSGDIEFVGRSLGEMRPTERLKAGIGFVPQGRCNFPLMTVRENLDLGAYLLDRNTVAEAAERVLSIFPVLRERLSVQAGNLSGGEQQILETAMVMEATPKLLLLDEPTLGLSPINQAQIFETIEEIRTGGVTIVMVEQNAFGALQISDTAVVLELGRKLFEGSAEEISQDERVKAAYLGG